MRIAFAGNPNSGKTTMYNALTGRNERVGNWAGVTVDKKESAIKKAYCDGSEQLSTRYVLPADHRIETTALYTYVLYTFDGVGIADDTIAVFTVKTHAAHQAICFGSMAGKREILPDNQSVALSLTASESFSILMNSSAARLR